MRKRQQRAAKDNGQPDRNDRFYVMRLGVHAPGVDVGTGKSKVTRAALGPKRTVFIADPKTLRQPDNRWRPPPPSEAPGATP